MLYYVFQAMCEPQEAGIGRGNGLTEEVIFPGETFLKADELARIVLGDRYRGTTTVPVTQAMLIKF